MKLYEIDPKVREILDHAAQSETGELSEADNLELTRLEAEFPRIAEFIAMKHREHLADAAGYKAEADMLAKKAQASANRAESLKQYIFKEMQRRMMTKFTGKILGARIQANPPRVEVIDAALIPATYRILQLPSMDSAAILAALKSGVAVPGAKITVGSHLRIV